MRPFQTAHHPPHHIRPIRQPHPVLRPALFYFTLTFLTGCVLGALRVTYIIPILHIDRAVAETCEMPLMLAAMAGWARFVMARYQVPPVRRLRLGIGALAWGCMVLVEVAGEQWVRAGEVVGSRRDVVARGAFVAALVVFGLMPWMVVGMGLETGRISRAGRNDG